jgi:hypothetical protein
MSKPIETPPKPIEFTYTDPLEISIHRKDGAWDIQPIGKSRARCKTRLEEDLPDIQEEWRNHMDDHAPQLPHFLRPLQKKKEHVPVVVREGECTAHIQKSRHGETRPHPSGSLLPTRESPAVILRVPSIHPNFTRNQIFTAPTRAWRLQIIIRSYFSIDSFNL